MTNVLNKGLLTAVREYAMVTLGVVAYALGWTIFLLPNNLIGGGVSGFSSIVYYATGLRPECHTSPDRNQDFGDRLRR